METTNETKILRNIDPKIAPQIFPLPPFNDTPPITAEAIEVMLIVAPIVGFPAQIEALMHKPPIPAAKPAKVCIKKRSRDTFMPVA